MRTHGAARTALTALLLATMSWPAAAQLPADSVVHRIIDTRVAEGRSRGIVVGLLGTDGSTRFIAAGDPGEGRMSLDRHSVFEIGSITKVFTGILLADMVRRGEVALDDPVSMYLPDDVTVPSQDGQPITLAHLATQTSGLPRMPSDFRPGDPTNPYADYTVEQLYAFLGGHTLRRAPGAQYEYSNVGVGLLGHVLALRADTSYEALVKARILEPLGMEHTAIALTPWMRDHMTAGHSPSGDGVPLWDIPTLAGAGALRSTAEDMLILLEAQVRGSGAVHESMRAATRRRAPTTIDNTAIGLGWHRRAVGGDTIVWHNGGTGGYRTFVGFDPAAGTGVVVLTNTSGEGADDIGFHLLDADLPLRRAERTAIDVPAATLERYTGTYEVSPQLRIEVTREGSVLWALPTNQPRVRLWPESPTQFFIREVDAQVTFTVAEDGTVTGLVLRQDGRDMAGRRVTSSGSLHP